MALYGTFGYGSGILYTGPATDKPVSLDFYRTDTDNLYTFHWLFNQTYYSPALKTLDYQLQIDDDPAFPSPFVHETSSETASIIASGYSQSGAYAAINIAGGLTLDIDVDGDGVQTIALANNVTGATIAADIQSKVQALTANDPVNQPAYTGFTCAFNGTLNQYKLISGSTGVASTVVISGGTAASSLYLGLVEGGYEVRGNSHILSQSARRILLVENGSQQFVDVSSATNIPGVDQFVVSLSTNQITFNTANMPDTISIVYVATSSEDITQFQRGNVAKGLTVPVFPRIDSERFTFYARVRVKKGLSYGPFSDTLVVRTLADVTKESSDRLLQALPDRHVYPIDESYRSLADRRTNIAKVYWGLGEEFDNFYLEKENAIRDLRQTRTRDHRLYDILGFKYSYPKPGTMEFVDYRAIVSNLKLASLAGGSFEAVKLVGRAFTGVDPTIVPFSQSLNFLTANESITIEHVTVPLAAPYEVTLTAGVRQDPIIPGSLYSGAVVAVTEIGLTVPSVPGPYTATLSQRPANIPTIAGYTYTNGDPAASEFAVDYATGVLTFNSADAGDVFNVTYMPNPDLTGLTLDINVDGDGIQTITLDGPFSSKEEIAANVQQKVRELTAVAPVNQEALTNFIAWYNSAADQYVLISGNTAPTSSSSVVVLGGTAASPMRLLLIDGATATTGLSYQTPPGPAAPGSFVSNIDIGNGSLLTFEGVAEAGNLHTVIYKKKSTVHSYLPHTTTEVLAVPGVSPYVVTLANSPVNIPSIAGFTYVTTTPGVGEFTVDFAAGELTFNAADAGAGISVLYVSTVPTPPTLFGRVETGFGIKIILNNPGNFELDKTNIAFLLKQILPAHTKFVLV